MSKKDYQALASAIFLAHGELIACGQADDVAQEARTHFAHAIATALEVNPRFDYDRFIEACETGKTRGMRQVVR